MDVEGKAILLFDGAMLATDSRCTEAAQMPKVLILGRSRHHNDGVLIKQLLLAHIFQRGESQRVLRGRTSKTDA